MVFLYNASIQFYIFVIRIASLFNPKAKLWLKGRKGWKQKLSKCIVPNSNYIWIHCASLGEFEQGRPVIESIKSKYPQYKVLLTFFSPSGYEVRKNYNQADIIMYLPADSRKNAQFFYKTVKPQIAIFIKYEFWHHYIHILHKNNIPVFLVSGIFRPNQIFFKWYGSWYKKILKKFEYLYIQNQYSLELLKNAGISNASISGDTRFDRVLQINKTGKEIPEAKKFCNNHFTIVCGSTWPLDEELIFNWFKSAPENTKIIIAPHEITENHLSQIESICHCKTVRFSKYNSSTQDARVLIIDNIGMLSSLYRYGKIAFIGGGFGKGIHNILEAAVYGIPVLFGPNHKKFSEAVQLSELKGAFPISNQDNTNNTLNELMSNQQLLENSSRIAGEYVASNAGATEKVIEGFKNYL